MVEEIEDDRKKLEKIVKGIKFENKNRFGKTKYSKNKNKNKNEATMKRKRKKKKKKGPEFLLPCEGD